jgi:radical SAM superfamily enzyme YgiQ (UPF0313 family)
MNNSSKILFVKPPDRFLEDEFVYQQLGPHYLQSFLSSHGFDSDLLILYRDRSEAELSSTINLEQLLMLGVYSDGTTFEGAFNFDFFEFYDIVGMSVMTPQAPDAYLLNTALKKRFPKITTIIGGSHPRYYQKQVEELPESESFHFVVPQDGWRPMLQIACGSVVKRGTSITLIDNHEKLINLPPPTRPPLLLEKYNFQIGGVPAFHAVSALGCPFTCHFCESGVERVRLFSNQIVSEDLKNIAHAHQSLKHSKRGLMFFDDVGLMSPLQVSRLAEHISNAGFDTWRAFTHAYLVVKHKNKILAPFVNSGGKRIGIGLETGSQRSLDLINKRNGKSQSVRDHYDAVTIANEHGIAVDAFTMIYPWEDEHDLSETTDLVEFIATSPVNGIDDQGRPLRNHVDSTIMSPYQGTKFFDMIRLGNLPGVELDLTVDPGRMYYKGNQGGSGWPYLKTRLPRSIYEEAQAYRNSLRPKYR